MKYLIKFSYDGTKFHGFQRQKDVKNVQKTIEDTLSKVLNESIVIKGAGRTDALVHALCQCASFDTTHILNKKTIKKINHLLNNDIYIFSYKKVNNSFHARYSVKEKTYVYKINIGKYDKEKIGYYYQLKYKLDYNKMKKAVKILTGTHNYQNFVSGKRDNYESTIYNIKLKKTKDTLIFTFRGIGFYRYMVRHLVGALLDIGKNKLTLDELNDLINLKIIKSSSVVPAEGLYLTKIKY